MIKKTSLLLAALLASLVLTACGTGTSTPPVTESDLAAVTSVQESAEITADIPAGIYVTGEQPDSITFSWNGDAVLRWTEDCSTPDTASEAAENGTIPLVYRDTGDGASYQSVIRCALFSGDERVSDTYTFVYTHAAADRFTMPVVSMVSDDDNFYNYDTGILVPGRLGEEDNPIGWQAWYHAANYYMRGIEWERPIALSVFDELGNLQLSQNCGVRVSGGYTRVNIQKSLRVYARKTYTSDTGVFPYAFWGALRGSQTGMPVSYSDTVLFRGGSNNEYNAVFTTPCLLLLLEGTDIDAPAVQPVVEYINGQYRGVVTQLEDYDEDYFEHHYGVTKENLTTMKGSVGEVFEKAGWRVDDGPAEERSVFLNMLKFVVNNDMSDPENYAEACRMLDMRNVIEYFAFELYINNTDWPGNNMRVWRYNGNDTEDGYNPDAEGAFDGRWRFLTKDLDLSFGYHDSNQSSNPFDYLQADCGLLMRNMVNSLLGNPEFADLFYSYMFTLAGEIVSPERCGKIFDLMQVYTGREVAYSVSAIGIAGSSRGNWNNGINVMRQFSKTRSAMIPRFTRNETDREYTDITVSITGEGEVRLGWYAVADGDTRTYLCDTRIPLEAQNAEITVTGGHIDKDGYLIADEETCAVAVAFGEAQPEEAAPATVVINEVKFRDTETEWIELYNPTDEAVTLAGWSLGKSEDPEKAQRFDTTVMEPHGFALICCTDYANTANLEGLRVTMSIGNGDRLILFDADGAAADSLTCETLSKTVHLGRYPDGGDFVGMASNEATPGAANAVGEYEGAFTSDNFEPYLLAWGRPYVWDDYFYEKDGETYVRRDAMLKLCEERAGSSTLTIWVRENNRAFTLDELVSATEDMKEATVRYVRELDSVIIS